MTTWRTDYTAPGLVPRRVTADDVRSHLAGDHTNCQHGYCAWTPKPEQDRGEREAPHD